MKLKTPSFYLTIATLSLTSALSAQNQQSDSAFIDIAIRSAINVYHQKMQNSAGLYNGSEYDEYNFNFQEGSPYFGFKDSVSGSIIYDGVLYENIFMKFDELRDLLVIWYNNDAVQLLNEKIDGFNIQNHSFIRIQKFDPKEMLTPGFYEQLYKGKTAVLKKTVKTLQQRTDITEGILRFIVQKNYYYVRTPNGYVQVSGKNDIGKALKNHSKEKEDFINSRKLDFKQNPEGFLVDVAAYYDTL